MIVSHGGIDNSELLQDGLERRSRSLWGVIMVAIEGYYRGEIQWGGTTTTGNQEGGRAIEKDLFRIRAAPRSEA